MDLVKILGICVPLLSSLPFVCFSQSAICAKGNSICIPEVRIYFEKKPKSLIYVVKTLFQFWKTLKTNGVIGYHFMTSEVLPTFIFLRVSFYGKHLLKFIQTDKLRKHRPADAEFLVGDAVLSFLKLNWFKIINNLQDYSKFDLPNETQTVVNVGIDIKDIPKIADKEFSVTLNAFFVVRWKDERLVIDQVNFPTFHLLLTYRQKLLFNHQMIFF